jgi:hypothetical protein
VRILELEALNSLLLSQVKSSGGDETGAGASGKGAVAAAAAEKALKATIRTGVASAWTATSGAMKSSRPMMEQGIKPALGPLVKAQEMLNNKASEFIGKIVTPAMDKVMESKAKPILSAICAPIIAGFVEVAKLFAQLAKAVRDKVAGDASLLSGYCVAARRCTILNISHAPGAVCSCT